MNWFQSLWHNMGGLLKPLWKGALIKLIQAETPNLAGLLKSQLASGGAGAIDKAFATTEHNLEAGLAQLSFIPESWRQLVNQAIEQNGNEWRDKLKAGVAADGPQAIDITLLQAENALIARIQAL